MYPSLFPVNSYLDIFLNTSLIHLFYGEVTNNYCEFNNRCAIIYFRVQLMLI